MWLDKYVKNFIYVSIWNQWLVLMKSNLFVKLLTKDYMSTTDVYHLIILYHTFHTCNKY